MLYPVYCCTLLASGVLMLCASSYVIYRIYKGSKSNFAYVLMAFTFLDGVVCLATFFIFVNFSKRSIQVDGYTFETINFYADYTAGYCSDLIAL